MVRIEVLHALPLMAGIRFRRAAGQCRDKWKQWDLPAITITGEQVHVLRDRLDSLVAVSPMLAALAQQLWRLAPTLP